MHLGKPKNLLILILLLANLMLAGLLCWRVWDGARARAETDRRVIELLAVRGVHVSKLPDAQLRVPSLTVRRSHADEAAAVLYLLGPAAAEDGGGGIMGYAGDAGTAQFLAGGNFFIRPLRGEAGNAGEARETGQDALAAAASRALSGMGLKNSAPGWAYAETPGGTYEITFRQTIQGCEVFNAYANFTYDASGRLTQAGGTWCFGPPQADGAAPCRSAGSVLLEYAAAHDGDPLDIRDIQLGYRLKPTPPDAAILSPEWRIVCDGFELYLDAYTAQPSRE